MSLRESGGFDRAAASGRLRRDIETMASFSAGEVGVTRLSFTDEYRDALDYLEREFTAIGFTVEYDPVGNFVASNVDPEESCVALGSHIDSVPEGGRYDGTAGVLCALEVARNVPERPLKVFSFVEEEGARFGRGLLGSRYAVGEVTCEELRSYRDASGMSFFEAACGFGHVPKDVTGPAEAFRGVECYVEVHIEQGRLLEESNHDIGIVDGIVGVVHATLDIEGRADHAGTTPMDLRSDAGLTAAEIVVEVEVAARALGGSVVATVGRVDLRPGALNVVPGRASVGLDIRDTKIERVDAVLERVAAFARDRAEARGQTVDLTEHLRTAPTPMSADVVTALEDAVSCIGLSAKTMSSGAGHDAMMVARVVPSGMLFVESRDGLSHSPEEYSDPDDLARAVEAILRFLAHRSS